MNKTAVLIKALRKNGRNRLVVSKMGKESNNVSLEELSGFLVPGVLVLLGGVTGWLLSVGPLKGGVPNLGMALKLLCTMLTMMTVVLTLMKMVTTMYFSDDLHVILSLPLSQGQVTLARIIIVAEKQYLNTALVVIPFTVVWAIMAEATANELLAAALMVLFLPALVMFVVGIVIMILMRCIRLIRNKNLMKILGGVLGLILLNVIMIFAQVKPKEDETFANALVNMIVSMNSATETYFPVSGLIGEIAANGTLSAMLILAGSTILAGGLFLLAAKTLYLPAALSMSEASDSKRVLKEDEIRKAMVSHDQTKALVKRDLRTVLRTPAFLTNGVVSPLGTSLFFGVIMVIMTPQAVNMVLAGRAASVSFVFAMSGLAAALAYATSINPALSAFSMEGNSFTVTKTMPIAPETLLKAKRNNALIFGIMTTTVPMMFFLIVKCAVGVLPPLALLYGPGFSVAALWISAEVNILTDLSKPNFDWENPTDTKKNSPMIFMVLIGFALVVGGAVGLTYLWRLPGGFPYAGHVVYGVFTVLAIVAAVLYEKHYFKKGAKLLAQL